MATMTDAAVAAPLNAQEIEALSYEQARDALVAVVDELERGGTSLEQSLALWERGEALAQRCESWLIGARARLEAARSGDAAPQA
jgi:exodeoxyribonuclease VII small subunit